MPQPFEVHSKYVALNAFRVSAFISCFYLSENTFWSKTFKYLSSIDREVNYG